MSPQSFDVLYEDNHLLIVNKHAGKPTMGVATGQPSLLAEAKSYVKHKYAKPGNVYLGVVSRLDAPVSGVLVIARTSKAAARLTRQFQAGEVEKVYWALVEKPLTPDQGQCVDWLRKDERHRRVHVTAQQASGARQARLTYQTLRRLGPRALLEVRLDTGRKHQIRVQLAHRGAPIVGDRKYGAQSRMDHGIALHSRRLSLAHPVRGERLTVTAPLPPSWRRLGLGHDGRPC